MTFDSSASTGSISSYTWDFGDGVGFSNEPIPSYTYNNAGDYLVTLTLAACAGCHKSFADDDFGNERIAGIVRSKLHQRNNPIDGDV
ncbi:MAG UNVERIFIED_CONTAM: PKD domain-containing protein [Anaerolineae bacterium]